MIGNDIANDIIISKTEFFYKKFSKKESIYKIKNILVLENELNKNNKIDYILDDIVNAFDEFRRKFERIRRLAISLVRRLRDLAEINFAQVEVTSSSTLASCMGDTIFVSTLLAELIEDNIDVWAAVLSHEIAHMENRLFRGYGSSQPYNHAEEYRADSRGLAIMIQAGFNPQGMIRLFELIQKVYGDAESLTHPSPSKRIKRTRTQLESYDGVMAKNSSLAFHHAYA